MFEATDIIGYAARVLNFTGFAVLFLTAKWLYQDPKGKNFIYAILLTGLYTFFSIEPLAKDISVRETVQAELASRPKSQMQQLTSLYIPQAEYGCLSGVCWANRFEGIYVDLVSFAAQNNGIFLETGTNPILRWRYVNDPQICRTDTEARTLNQYQIELEIWMCFLLDEVETSQAELRLEFDFFPEENLAGKRFTLIDQETNTVVDKVFRYSPEIIGYPFLLGSLLLKRTPFFGFEFDDNPDGAISDMIALIERQSFANINDVNQN